MIMVWYMATPVETTFIGFFTNADFIVHENGKKYSAANRKDGIVKLQFSLEWQEIGYTWTIFTRMQAIMGGENELLG